ncbi:hypothetical protein DOTSEDRAFT_38426 [Dothistroma septosporum NZE10]|uniref:Uncharacterized protein n=1 Tax=Dothistroma septosporum (strain NZE10 / CBS 128990) TaxID=675120 RepID=M2XI97_DOTSN|nr:hypothetical protein DOTSEDRAFT_38426 [Dothistroma septosporum NZE10]
MPAAKGSGFESGTEYVPTSQGRHLKSPTKFLPSRSNKTTSPRSLPQPTQQFPKIMSHFSYLGAFATLAAYQRLSGNNEAATLYQAFYHPSKANSSDETSTLPLAIRLTQFLTSITLSLIAGGYIVGVHGHLLPASPEQSDAILTARVPETMSMVWLIAMCVIALFGVGESLGLNLRAFGTAWGEMVDWVHEQAKGEE